ncbi:MAG: NADH-quinone oxidoreductase subunit J [Thiothrix sp.]|nr:MAG: NADH-quinone oxidoreductase subunit J [Thiothrix sp.]
MSFTGFLFYFFAIIQVLAAVRVITVKNPVHAALFLVLTFVSASALWLLLEAEFLGIVLVLVYVGAVMVLFLFVVMMLDINIAELRAGFIGYLPVGLLVALAMVVMMGLVLTQKIFQQEAPAPAALSANNTEALGSVLYTDYVYSFELAAVILLVAIVAAITLTMRRRPGTKHQDITKQVRVRREDRIRLVDIKSESKQAEE